ncbi:glycosyltransferase [Immundisolibacter sp.]|uniref:glycosyltransferase n=1 Tax=Immundisolibacter sp. TaxID=1934948 RepID=UPI003566CC57
MSQVRDDAAYRSAVARLAQRFLVDELHKTTPIWLRAAIAEVADQYQIDGGSVFDDLVRALFRSWWRLPLGALLRDAADKLARIGRIGSFYLWQRLYGYREKPPLSFPSVEDQCRGLPDLSSSKVSIVVLSYNRLPYLKTTLASLYATAGYDNFELIVVDNGSSDRSVAYLKALYAAGKVDKLILSGRNLGTSAGYNQGFARADPESEFLMKFDSDIVALSRGWLQEIVSCFKAQPNLGLVALTVCNHAGLRNIPTVTQHGRRVKPMWFGIMGAAGFTFRREVLDRIGYFNEDFDYLYMPDDIDYVYRVVADGREAYYLADYLAFERRDLDRQKFLRYEKRKKQKPPLGLMRRYFSGEKNRKIVYRSYQSASLGPTPRLIKLETASTSNAGGQVVS